VITFAEIALCTLLGALALAVLIALVLGVQLARQHLAERRATSIAATPVMRAEVLEDGARAAVPQGTQRAIQGKSPVSAIGQQQITGGADDWEEARQWL
jgi:hypothetical protein